jgi:DNA mismatch endonuclease (patch repair protein)
VDPLTSAQRSAHMRQIRGKNTKPEIVVRRAAHRLGYRFRLHAKGLPGSPDLVFPSRRKVVFVQGCFWHQHADVACKLAKRPKSRLDYWLPKLRENIDRDRRQQAALMERGWEVLEVWECQVNDRQGLATLLATFLGAVPLSTNGRQNVAFARCPSPPRE